MSPPAQHVEEAWQSAEFFANKVLMEHRGTNDAHVDWIKRLKALTIALGDFVRQLHPAGPAWTSGGVSVSEFQGEPELSLEAPQRPSRK